MRISDWSSDVCSSDLRRKLRLWSVALHAPMGTRLYRRLLRPDGTLCFRAASRSDTLGHGSTCGIAAVVVRGRTADCGTGALSRPLSELADPELFSSFMLTALPAPSRS